MTQSEVVMVPVYPPSRLKPPVLVETQSSLFLEIGDEDFGSEIDESDIDDELDDIYILDSEVTEFELKWTDKPTPSIQQQHHYDSEVTNISPQADEWPAFGFMLLMFPLTIVHIIATETNRYAKQFISFEKKKNPSKHRYTTFKPTSILELYCWFGMCIAMSIGPKQPQRDFWSTNTTGGYTSQEFGRIMPRARFEDIKRFLHFTNNEDLVPPGSPGYSKLGKLGKIFDIFNSLFQKYFIPGSWVNVDEAMIKSWHRSHLRQYMKNKPDKYGFKL